jgi:hypothetical protein
MVPGEPYTSTSDQQHATAPWTNQLFASGNVAATLIIQKNPQFAAQLSSSTETEQRAAIATLSRLWRTPVAKTELTRFATLRSSVQSTLSSDAASLLTVRLALSSPASFFRSEWGTKGSSGTYALTSYELADLISQTLIDGPPDQQLWASALDGSLVDPKVIESHVTRILAEKPPYAFILDTGTEFPKGEPQSRRRLRGILRFLYEWLELGALDSKIFADKDGGERAKRWLTNEPILLALHVLWSDTPTLKRLLKEAITFNSGTLAKYYNLPAPTASTETPRPSADNRMGLLNQGAFLASHPTTSSRGKWIRTRLLCQPVPLPMGDINMDLTQIEKDLETAEKKQLSPREVRSRHLSTPYCKSCHDLIDPLAYPLDTFDPMGQARTMWNGFPIDTAGSVANTANSNKAVAGSSELIDLLADSPDVRRCFVEQLYTFMHGRSIEPEDACHVDSLVASFEKSGGNIRTLILEALTADEMRFRRAGSTP